MRQTNDHLFADRNMVRVDLEVNNHQDPLLIKFRRSIPTSLTVAEVLTHLRSIKQIKEEGTSC